MDNKVYSKAKILGIFCGFLTFILIISLRLFYLQIYKGESFSTRSESNFLRMEVLDSPRGNVLDCNGLMLATNRPVFDIYWEGSGNRYITTQQHEILTKVFDILGEDKETLKLFNSVERFSRRRRIKEDVPFEDLCKISEQCSHSNNLIVVNHFKRTYPHKNVASHLLGYLSRPRKREVVGRYGIEKIFQENLEGEKGYVLHVMNSTGKRLERREEKQAMAGTDIKLTIDRDMQLMAESLFLEETQGVFIVMDPEDGAIKSLVSYPNFDPNLFVEKMSADNWESLSNKNSPFLNRTTNALYPPASIFKLVTFTAGLEESVIDKDMEFDCKGFISFYGRKYNCIRRYGHGKISCNDAIAHSCNIPCYEIARRIGVDQIAKYAFKYGLGMNTGSIIAEKEGLVPTREWKKINKHENWWKGETLSTCIGQSYLLVTPLQIARMISAICSGNLVRPRILVDEEVEIKPLEIKDETLEFLRNAMKSTVEIGSGRRLKLLKDFSIHAKTGTAQTASLAKGQLEHGWFALYFSYKDEKPLVIISLVERAGTSRPALLMAKKFLQLYASMRRSYEQA